MELSEFLKNVDDRESFVLFVKALIKDRENARMIEDDTPEEYKFGYALNWQNASVENFLDGAVSWLEDSDRNDISWKLMAEFLYCGKIYE